MDYPWSTELLDAAVGAASGAERPPQVTFSHLVGTLDDRLAMLAARRCEICPVIDHHSAPSDGEIA